MKLSDIQNSIETLNGVGPATARQFASLGIFTVADLLQKYPRSWEDRSVTIPLCEWAQHPKVNTVCKVMSHIWFGFGRMKTLKIAVTDGTANAYLVAFNRNFLEKTLPEGSIIRVTGRFDVKYNELQSTVFEAERLALEGEISDFAVVPSAGVLPLYGLTEGLTQKTYRKAVASAIKLYAKSIDDELPENIIKERKLMNKARAIASIHGSSCGSELAEARQSLIYEELFNFELKLAKRTLEHRGRLPDFSETDFSRKEEKPLPDLENRFRASLSPRQKLLLERLSFDLTEGQKQAILEMNLDMDRSEIDRAKVASEPESLKDGCFSMQRLLQGDVGSGKTLTAFFICLRAIDSKGQCAFLAPTELLARQHADNAARLLEPLGVKVAFLTGNVKAKGRSYLLEALKMKNIDLVIGTHALFSPNVEFADLTLAVIDEQHRFGVAQREAIINKGRLTKGNVTHTTNLLMMSATPIPQTLSYTLFGDLDISTIKTMPGGRKPVVTYLSVMGHEAKVYAAVKSELSQGHQAYFVYPRISEDEEDDSQGLKAATEMYEYLSFRVFPEYKCALIHGKTPDEEQKQILDDFKKGEIKVLVATTVVEVGVDVAAATCMVVEHADRFGLAELHQLRGRVGRSDLQSYCFLIYSKNITETGIFRMKALHETTDGFKIAEEDLKQRGPGELTGTVQSGYLQFALADLNRDQEILKAARLDAINFLKQRMTEGHGNAAAGEGD